MPPTDARWHPTPWTRSGILLAALLSALASMHVLLLELSWWIFPGLIALVVLGAVTIVRSVSRARLLPSLVGLAAGAVALTVGYASDVAWALVVPNADVVARWWAIGASGLQSIAEQGLPASPDPGIVFFLALGMIVAALIGGVAVRRAPALTALPLLGLLATPVVIRPASVDALWWVVTAALWLVMLRFDRRPTGRRVMLLVGSAVAVASLLTPALLPATRPATPPTGTALTVGLNPLVDLGQNLRRGAPTTALTYTTSGSAGVYLRLATLDRFTGSRWSPTTVAADSTRSLDNFGPPAGLAGDVAASTQNVNVQVGAVSGSWLPLPYPTQSVTGVTGPWTWEPNGLSAESATADVSGQNYAASYLDVAPTAAQLAVAQPTPGGTSPDLALPRNLPAIIRDTAQQVAGTGSSYQRAMALQTWFTSGAFTYSEDAPVQQGYDGVGTDVIAQFLAVRAGYCVHFASTMAVMARSLGIPARIVVGFAPGTAAQATPGGTVHTVTTHDMHAWPELYLDGIGWLRFEPTPGIGAAPAYGATTPAAASAAPSAAASASAAPSATPGASSAATPGVRPPAEALSGGTPVDTAQSAAPFAVLGTIAALLLLALVPAGLRAGVRARRLRRIRTGRDPAMHAWAELRDTARDYGWVASETETVRAFAGRLAVVMPDGSVLAGLREDVETAAYAPPGRAVVDVGELRAARAAIARASSPAERMRAILLPASLFRRFGAAPEG